jgi:23S rRNA (cytosine1962-C5)-methyltransferase
LYFTLERQQHTTLADYPQLRLRKKEERRLLAGHLWAFSNELVEVPRNLPAGTVVTLVRDTDSSPIGHAFFNPHSLIAARILTRDISETIDEDFFTRRLQAAANRRMLLRKQRNAVRLVHGESDFLPGLIVDQFDDILSYQIASAGFEPIQPMIVDILKGLFNPRSIVEKNNTNLRKLEGLPLGERVVFGSETSVTIHDAAGTSFEVDVLQGQKTGFFLDQMENRSRIRDFVKEGDRVLDLFSNEGGFALNAARAGAREVLAVDASRSALTRLVRNAELNGVTDKTSTAEADVFGYLQSTDPHPYDLVVLDPPALAKSRKDIIPARKGYVQLNTNAMKLVARDGILVTASCSHHIPRELLHEVIREASRRARRDVTILEERGAGIDHPVLSAMPETSYLKVFILRVH